MSEERSLKTAIRCDPNLGGGLGPPRASPLSRSQNWSLPARAHQASLMSWRACTSWTTRWAHTCAGAQVTFLQRCPGCYTLWSHSQGESKQSCLLGPGHLLSLRAQVAPELPPPPKVPLASMRPQPCFLGGDSSSGGGAKGTVAPRCCSHRPPPCPVDSSEGHWLYIPSLRDRSGSQGLPQLHSCEARA